MVNKLMTQMGSLVFYAAMLMQNVTMKLVWGDRAATDGKSYISLPSSLIRDAKFMAKAFGYLLHEVGHNLFTDMGQFLKSKPGLEREMTNVIEDPRMEKCLYTKFAGAMARLTELVKVLVEDQFFEPVSSQASPADLLCTYCLYRLRADYLNQTALSEYADQAESLMHQQFPKGAMIRLRVLLREIDSIQDAAGSVLLARKILTMIDEEIKKDQQQQQSQQGEQSQTGQGESGQGQSSSGQDQDDGQGSASGNDGDDSDDASDKGESSTDSGKGQSDEASDEDGQGDSSQGKQSGQDDDSSANDASGSGNGASAHDEKPSPYQDTVDSLKNGPDNRYDMGKRLEESLNEDNDKAQDNLQEQGVYGQIEPYSGFHDDHRAIRDMQLENEAMGQTNVLRARLRNMLQSVTDVHCRKARHGRLDTRALPKMVMGNPKVFLKFDDKIDVNTDLVICADISGSIGGNDTLVSQSCYAVAAACDVIDGLNCSVFIFPGYQGRTDRIKSFDEHANRCSGRFRLRHHGGTPMANAIMAGALELQQGHGKRKLMLTITDGGPDEWHYTKYLIDDCVQSGIEMLGLGIGNGQRADALFPVHAEIESFDQLSAAMFSLLQGRLFMAA